jgi:hypothetical protein
MLVIESSLVEHMSDFLSAKGEARTKILKNQYQQSRYKIQTEKRVF